VRTSHQTHLQTCSSTVSTLPGAQGAEPAPGLQSEFQDSQGYTEKHCLKKQNKQTKPNQTKTKIKKKKKKKKQASKQASINSAYKVEGVLTRLQEAQSDFKVMAPGSGIPHAIHNTFLPQWGMGLASDTPHMHAHTLS
jgi:hypothetical protein